MALAGGCVTGILWKAGSGSVALAIAIAGFAIGELLIRGPGDGAISTLDDASRPTARGLPDVLGVGYTPLALVLGAVGLGLLARRGPRGLLPGLALGLVAAGAWIAADGAGYGYGLGFVGAAEGTRRALATGGALPYVLWLAIGVVLGGAVTGPRRLRVPDATRAARAAAGGLAMGVGGTLAHGCNIGNGLTGIPLLSLGSMLATAAMAAGALLDLAARRLPRRLARWRLDRRRPFDGRRHLVARGLGLRRPCRWRPAARPLDLELLRHEERADHEHAASTCASSVSRRVDAEPQPEPVGQLAADRRDREPADPCIVRAVWPTITTSTKPIITPVTIEHLLVGQLALEHERAGARRRTSAAGRAPAPSTHRRPCPRSAASDCRNSTVSKPSR